MAKGIIYVMTSVISGVIKIGKTGFDSFEDRMRFLESNGYANISGLKRSFAIEVNDYDEKEKLIHEIFSKSRIGVSELFALDENLAIQLLSSFDGRIVYPVDEKKEDIFTEATEYNNLSLIPDGEYTFKRKKNSDNKKILIAKAKFEKGTWVLLKDSILGISCDAKGQLSKRIKETREGMKIDTEGRLLADFNLGKCTPSYAAAVVLYGPVNGWVSWLNVNGKVIDEFRAKE